MYLNGNLLNDVPAYVAESLTLPGIMSPDICSVSQEHKLIVVGSNASPQLHFVQYTPQGLVADVHRATAITPPRNLSRASVENVEQEHRPKGLGFVGHRLLVITAKQPQQLDVR